MSPVQNLVQFFFITQVSAIVLLIMAYAFDYNNYQLVAKGRYAIIPGLRKIARLFSLSKRPGFQVLYFFSAILIVFSYAAFVLLIIYTAGWFLGLL